MGITSTTVATLHQTASFAESLHGGSKFVLPEASVVCMSRTLISEIFLNYFMLAQMCLFVASNTAFVFSIVSSEEVTNFCSFQALVF